MGRVKRPFQNRFWQKLALNFSMQMNPQDCIQRIKMRVKLGGHFIPDEDVIRRYYRSKTHFWNTYKYLADVWLMIYNSTTEEPQKIAVGIGDNYVIELPNIFTNFLNDFKP